MLRKWIAGLAIGVLGTFLMAGPAMAETAAYNDGTVESETSTVADLDVAGTSEVLIPQEVPNQELEVAGESDTATISGSLSYTGVNFNVPLTIAIGAVIVLLGAGLVYGGSRGLFRRSSRAH